MGHWSNSWEFKAFKRRRERRIDAGERPLRLAVARGDAHLSAATVVEILGHLDRCRLIREVIAARPTHDWPGLHEWCWVREIILGYRWPNQLLREPVHGVVSFDAPQDWLDAARKRGRRVWQPLGPTLTRIEWEVSMASRARIALDQANGGL